MLQENKLPEKNANYGTSIPNLSKNIGQHFV